MNKAEMKRENGMKALEEQWRAKWVGTRMKFNAKALEFFNDPEQIKKHDLDSVVRDTDVGVIVGGGELGCATLDFGNGRVESFSMDWLECA